MNGRLRLVLLAAILAVPAHADFTETGTITATSSVTASAFFGDGSHLSGIGTQFVTSYSTGVSISSNVTLGTSSSTITISGAMSVSSVTVNLSGLSTTAQSSYVIATDTLTLTVSGRNLVEACYVGNIRSTGASNHIAWFVLVDHNYVMGESASVAAVSGYQQSSSESLPMSGCLPIPPGLLTAGSHTFAFGAGCTGSVCVYGGSSSPSVAYFYVKETH